MALQNKHSLGQNWLKDRVILDEIAMLAKGESSLYRELYPEQSFSNLKTTDLCLEIGPGLGTLTSALLRQFKKVIAVEYDEKLAKNLPNSFPGKNLQIIHQDFLQFDLLSITESYIVAGNIPYYITSPIIDRLLSAQHPPIRIVLLIQKEVAERIAAGPGHHTVLSLSVQNRASVLLGPVIKRDFFTPVPKVDSQVIILDPHKPEVSDRVMQMIKTGFSAPRKKLVNNLSEYQIAPILEQMSLSRDVRPADLSLSQWNFLTQKLEK